MPVRTPRKPPLRSADKLRTGSCPQSRGILLHTVGIVRAFWRVAGVASCVETEGVPRRVQLSDDDLARYYSQRGAFGRRQPPTTRSFCWRARRSDARCTRDGDRREGWPWFVRSFRIDPAAVPAVDRLEEMAIKAVRSRWDQVAKRSRIGWTGSGWEADPQEVAAVVAAVILGGGLCRPRGDRA